ncbi:MAG: hypothetical protein LBB88_01285 [Planctomycetaceae bacterium]|nr:hypothetical protein [Planctomycetaceae bacterium]
MQSRSGRQQFGKVCLPDRSYSIFSLIFTYNTTTTNTLLQLLQLIQLKNVQIFYRDGWLSDEST